MINILKNIYYFFQILFSKNLTTWDLLIKNIKESNIHQQTTICPPCRIKSISLGKGSYIASNSIISNTIIGNFCSIGPNFLCGWGIHPTNGVSTSPIFYAKREVIKGLHFSQNDKVIERKPISIGNDVFIGANVVVLDGISIGDGAIIGAGAVVSKDIPPYAIAVGTPIKIIKYRFSDDIIKNLLEIKWWEKNDDVLKNVEKNFMNIEKFINENEHLQTSVSHGNES